MKTEEIIGFRRDDDQVTRVNLALDGENIAIMQQIPGVYTLTEPLPDLTQEEVDGFIEAVQGERDGVDTRERIEAALYASMDRCARCKVCNVQVDAVMASLGYPPRNAS